MVACLLQEQPNDFARSHCLLYPWIGLIRSVAVSALIGRQVHNAAPKAWCRNLGPTSSMWGNGEKLQNIGRSRQACLRFCVISMLVAEQFLAGDGNCQIGAQHFSSAAASDGDGFFC